MRYITANAVCGSEAENVVATIWIAVEKHGLSSPKITTFSKASSREIEFLFESQHDESLVRAELPRAMRRKMSSCATAGNIKALSATALSEILSEHELYTATLVALRNRRGAPRGHQ
jgi:hypothetical protein